MNIGQLNRFAVFSNNQNTNGGRIKLSSIASENKATDSVCFKGNNKFIMPGDDISKEIFNVIDEKAFLEGLSVKINNSLQEDTVSLFYKSLKLRACILFNYLSDVSWDKIDQNMLLFKNRNQIEVPEASLYDEEFVISSLNYFRIKEAKIFNLDENATWAQIRRKKEEMVEGFGKK